MKLSRLLLIVLAFVSSALSVDAALVKVDSLKFNNRNWVYFGWAEDHPKALSLMGGGLYARRPRLAKHDDHSWDFTKEKWHEDSDKPVFFLLSVDGSEPYYPNEFSKTRRQEIDWHLAENNLPFPVSCWEYEGVKMQITHVGRRILDNAVNVVYTQVVISNNDDVPHEVTLHVAGTSVAERCFFLKKVRYSQNGREIVTKTTKLNPGKSQIFELVIPANGTADKERILANGDFAENYDAEKALIERRMASLTMPTALPDEDFIDMWKASMTYMWHATVKTPYDYEQRGSGGNAYGFYQYDRIFDHDVPDMVIQYIIEGDWDVARQIMGGATYDRLSSGELKREAYLDAIPKYIITFAQYLQLSGDKTYFTDELMRNLKRCSRAVHDMREFTDEAKDFGVYGLIRKGHTLDNNAKTYLLVDNFAALHGFTAYKYICEQMGDSVEAEWADKELVDLNDCLNAAIRKSVSDRDMNWYCACFSFDMDYHLLSGPGNWLGTTFMMPSFPWNAQLKGFDLRGEWFDYLDNSVKVWQEVSKFYPAGKNLVGAWWGAKYGAAYDTAMVMQLLASDKYRTMTVRSLRALLDNQSGPLIWGESFHAPASEGDWTIPEVDLETWALGFIRQAMLQMCASVKSDGDVVIGRGISDDWILSEKPISWERIRINNGKQIDLTIQKVGLNLEITIQGDVNDGDYIVDIPYCVDNIADVKTEGGKLLNIDSKAGKATVSGDTSKIIVELVR